MKKQLLKFELPLLVDAPNYHEFSSTVSFIQFLVGKKVKILHEELFCMGSYVAIIFDKDNKPSLEDVIELLINKKFTPGFLENVDFMYNNDVVPSNEIKSIAQKIKLSHGIKKNEMIQKSNKI